MAQIGIHLKRLRLRRKLSVRDLAERSGISHATISLVERDRTSPSVDTLSAMLDALGTTLVGFFDGLQTTLTYSPFYDEEDLVEIGDKDTISFDEGAAARIESDILRIAGRIETIIGDREQEVAGHRAQTQPPRPVGQADGDEGL